MAKKVAIVVDSTTPLPDNIFSGLNIHQIPLTVIWAGNTYLDGVEITPEEFYTKLATAKEMPSTTQPSPHEFQQVYEKLRDEDYDILSVVLSSKLSGTHASAMQARGAVEGTNIEVVDTETIAMAAGWPIWRAALAAQDGASLADCKHIATEAAKNTGMIFMVDTLEFLHRGGRIGGGARFIGTALNFKPMLEIQNGGIEAMGRTRSKKKAIRELINTLKERTDGKTHNYVAVLHAHAEEDAKTTLETIKSELSPDQTTLAALSPVVGTHTGPGSVAISYMTGYTK